MKVYIDTKQFDKILEIMSTDTDYTHYLIDKYGKLEDSYPFSKISIKEFIKQKYKITYTERWIPRQRLKKERALSGAKNRITMFLLKL